MSDGLKSKFIEIELMQKSTPHFVQYFAHADVCESGRLPLLLCSLASICCQCLSFCHQRVRLPVCPSVRPANKPLCVQCFLWPAPSLFTDRLRLLLLGLLLIAASLQLLTLQSANLTPLISSRLVSALCALSVHSWACHMHVRTIELSFLSRE